MSDDVMTCLYCGGPVRVSFMGQVERCPRRCGPLERFRDWAEEIAARHCDSGSDRNGEDARSAAEGEASQSGGSASERIAQPPSSPSPSRES